MIDLSPTHPVYAGMYVRTYVCTLERSLALFSPSSFESISSRLSLSILASLVTTLSLSLTASSYIFVTCTSGGGHSENTQEAHKHVKRAQLSQKQRLADMPSSSLPPLAPSWCVSIPSSFQLGMNVIHNMPTRLPFLLPHKEVDYPNVAHSWRLPNTLTGHSTVDTTLVYHSCTASVSHNLVHALQTRI